MYSKQMQDHRLVVVDERIMWKEAYSDLHSVSQTAQYIVHTHTHTHTHIHSAYLVSALANQMADRLSCISNKLETRWFLHMHIKTRTN